VTAAVLQCSVGSWSDAPVVCMPTCPVLEQPPRAIDCLKKVVSHTFSDASSLKFYYLEPRVPAVVSASWWSVGQGRLNVAVPPASPGHFKLSSPSWASTMRDAQWMEISFTVQVTSGVVEACA
jgi:hypothetical protein